MTRAHIVLWALSALSALVWTSAVVRTTWMLSSNPPPLRLVAVPGIEPWTEKELYRARTSFVGQFLSDGDGVWRVTAPDRNEWEVTYWDFARGVTRRWPVKAHPKQKAVLVQHSIALGPVAAGAMKLPDGDLSLVLHGQEPDSPVWLTRVKQKGGVTHHPLEKIRPHALAGFAFVSGRYEFLTRTCLLYELRPGKGLTLKTPGPCGPPHKRRVVEWASHTGKGWQIAYSEPASTRTDGKDQRTIHLATGPARPVRVLGDLKGRSRPPWEETIDPTPGNVMHLGPFIWHTHEIREGKLTPLKKPPAKLHAGMPRPRRVATQIIRLDPKGNRRFMVWHTVKVRETGHSAARSHKTITRWRFLFRMENRWLAVESPTGPGPHQIRLAGTNPDIKNAITLPRFPGHFSPVPAKDGGYWLFEGVGRYFRVDAKLRRKNLPGAGERISRILRLDHLQRSYVASTGGKLVRRSRLEALAHRWSLPIVLIGFPLLAIFVLPLFLAVRKRPTPEKRMYGVVLAAAALYLVCAGLLAHAFWTVTAVL